MKITVFTTLTEAKKAAKLMGGEVVELTAEPLAGKVRGCQPDETGTPSGQINKEKASWKS